MPHPRRSPRRPVDARAGSDKALALTIVALCGATLAACAGKREAELRAKWQEAARAAMGESGEESPETDTDGEEREERASTWEQLAAFVEAAAGQVAAGFATVDLERLAAGLCGGEPEAIEGERGTVYRCDPEPALVIDGHPLSLEIGKAGVIGLVAVELDERASEKLLSETLARAKEWCEGGLHELPRADDARQEFHTCLAKTGPQLAIGRFPSEATAGQWQFSLVVLAPG